MQELKERLIFAEQTFKEALENNGNLHPLIVGKCLGCDMALGNCRCNKYELTKEEWEKLRFPKQENLLTIMGDTNIMAYLSEWFTFNTEYETYISKKKWIGAGTGDDSTLCVMLDKRSTFVWWRENRGYENTIFDGKEIKTVKELETLFELLNLKLYGVLS